MLEAVEEMRCVLLCILEAVEGAICLLEVFEVLEMSEVVCCVLLCMLGTVEGALCSWRCWRCWRC